MRSDLQFKLLARLNNKKQESGFTLIELLVVVIIIGVLAAVALPNLLKQVGKARESELKNAVGTVNRAQQAYHFERQTFADDISLLGITLPDQYLTGFNLAGDADDATFETINSDYVNDGTRAYSGLITYSGGEYEQVMCQSNEVVEQIDAPSSTTDCGSDAVIVQ